MQLIALRKGRKMPMAVRALLGLSRLAQRAAARALMLSGAGEVRPVAAMARGEKVRIKALAPAEIRSARALRALVGDSTILPVADRPPVRREPSMENLGYARLPAGAVLCDPECRRLEMSSDGKLVLAGYHEAYGALFYTKWLPSDLPNDLISLDDLERAGILGRVDVPPIV